MTAYQIETKKQFTVAGLEMTINSQFNDFAGINREKTDFWTRINTDGSLAKLVSQAKDRSLYAVNEVVNNKMMHYAAVLPKNDQVDADRLIEFPSGAYLVVMGTAASQEELTAQLTGAVFGEILPQLTTYSYVGGPNAIQMQAVSDQFQGRALVPVVMN